MKRIFNPFILALLTLLPTTALAHDFEVDGIYYNINGTEATVTFKGTSSTQYSNEYTGSVNIPATVTYGGTTYSVTAIGNESFYNCSGLTSITIPNSVTTIGNATFDNCSGLTNVAIPNSVTSIGENAFSNCCELASINVESGNPNYDSRNYCNAIIETATNKLIAGCMNTAIPNSVTSIGNFAFEGCSGLTSITILNSITTIGYWAFKGCSRLTSISVDSGNPNYDSRNNCNAIIETATNKLIAGCMNTAIPNSVTSIGNYAFYGCSRLTSITIPASVTSIGPWAFYGCSGLTSVTIPNTVTSISNSAFRDCSGLTSITIPNTVTSIGTYAFYGCSGLTSITIPNAVTSIGSYAFYGCSGLTSITIPNSVKTINESAFYFCSGLTSVTIPNSVTSIGNWAFLGCSGLTSINIPNSVKYIGHDAFCHCSGLTSITIPNSVTSIGDEAFAGCSGLTSVIVASGNPKYDSRNNCNAIIETASNSLILGCMNTVIPNSVTTIGRSAFYRCSGLTSITIPNSVTNIDEWAFLSCSGLTSIIIPNSITSIRLGTFQECSGLNSITIPNSVTSIGNQAFYACIGLTSVTCLAVTPPTTSSSTFMGGVTSHATLYVPKGSVAAYQTADNWKHFSQIVGLMIGVDFEVDGVWYRALDESTAMVIQRPDEEFYQGDVVIPEAVTYEGYTFTVTAIDAGAFEDCFELNSVVIGDAVESIGENAFQGCTGLTSVTIGSGVTNIGAKAFNYCNALQTVTCRGTVPPVMASSNCFSNAAYSRAVLKVPRPEIETYAATDYWYKFSRIEGWGYLGPGDVNGSGTIDMDDLTLMINIMLTEDFGGINPSWADVNGNGIVSMNDLTELINILLTQ